MRFEFTQTFTKALRQLPSERVKRIKTSLKRFIEAPDRKGVRLHKLQGVDLYSLSARKDRIIMQKMEDQGEPVWRVLDVGAHDSVYRRMNRK